jgi:hypothetical protein
MGNEEIMRKDDEGKKESAHQSNQAVRLLSFLSSFSSLVGKNKVLSLCFIRS